MIIRHKASDAPLCDVPDVWLAGANLRRAALSGARLVHANLTRADLSQALLRSALLCHAVLSEANLTSCDLARANLYCACLSHTDLSHASLEKATLEGAVICHADLRGTDLGGANLRHANMTGSDLSGANLSEADLTGAILECICYDNTTRWPKGFCDAVLKSADVQGNQQTRRRSASSQVNKPGSHTIHLWTIQPLAVWDRLQRDKVLHTDPDCINPVYLRAYEWIRNQMSARVKEYYGHFPWWAWYRPKPDLRGHSRSSLPGDRQVRLHLAVPHERVLLSDYMSWHTVLNARFLAVSEAEDQAWVEELVQNGIDRFVWPLPEPWLSRVVASWERVFDLDVLADGGYWPVSTIQASFESLCLEHVVEVTTFMTR